jgi:membrane protease YdiL (CAAX protease family)
VPFIVTVFFSLVLIVVSLRVRCISLRDIGWRLEGWKRGLMLGLGAYALYAPLEDLVLQPVVNRLTLTLGGSLAPKAQMGGGGTSLLLVLLLGALVAPLLEETVFRGYMLARVAGPFGYSRTGWALALLISSSLFGLGHSVNPLWPVSGTLLPTAGGALSSNVMHALVLDTLFGFVAGGLYLLSGSKLIAPFAFHAAFNAHFDLLRLFGTSGWSA